jgi:murein hydrolase activator
MLAMLALVASVSIASGAAPSAKQAASELSRVQARIRAVTQAVQAEVAKRDRTAAALKTADEAERAARARLAEVHLRRTESESKRAALSAQRARVSAALTATQQTLAQALRAAYVAGRAPDLALLMNGADPGVLDRLRADTGYLGEARAEEIHAIGVKTAELAALDQALSTENAHLAALEAEQRHETESLDRARVAQQRALEELKERVATRAQELKDLKANAASLEDLLKRLRKALKDTPPPVATHGAFGQLRGQLLWPVAGRLGARFGDSRAGGLRWNGLLIEAPAHSEVRATAAGRVVYADWLPGLGLLMILDHGQGYLSLYGYNETLRRAVGESVRAGDPIATSGAGAGDRAALYFEIRDGTRPLDPTLWLKKSTLP